jgi:hypothetical protein
MDVSDYRETADILDHARAAVTSMPRNVPDGKLAEAAVKVFEKEVKDRRINEKLLICFFREYSLAITAASGFSTTNVSYERHTVDNQQKIDKLSELDQRICWMIVDKLSSPEADIKTWKHLVGGIWQLNDALVSNSSYGEVSFFRALKDRNTGIIGQVAAILSLQQNGMTVAMPPPDWDHRFGIDIIGYKNESDMDNGYPCLVGDVKSKVARNGGYSGVLEVLPFTGRDHWDKAKRAQYDKEIGYNVPHAVIYYPSVLDSPDFYREPVLGLPSDRGVGQMGNLVNKFIFQHA